VLQPSIVCVGDGVDSGVEVVLVGVVDSATTRGLKGF
jgi:hypothetical protein